MRHKTPNNFSLYGIASVLIAILAGDVHAQQSAGSVSVNMGRGNGRGVAQAGDQVPQTPASTIIAVYRGPGFFDDKILGEVSTTPKIQNNVNEAGEQTSGDPNADTSAAVNIVNTSSDVPLPKSSTSETKASSEPPLPLPAASALPPPPAAVVPPSPEIPPPLPSDVATPKAPETPAKPVNLLPPPLPNAEVLKKQTTEVLPTTPVPPIIPSLPPPPAPLTPPALPPLPK